ncbi:unnamed protein product, partial [Polarella glacialis]
TVGMTCGGIAGAFAGWVTTPLDVAKTRIMLESASGNSQPGMLAKVREIHGSAGVRGLFCGAATRTAYVGVSCALSFGAFEWAKSNLQRQ